MTADGPPASGSFPQAPPAPSLVGTVLDGRYRIIKLIGEGGMGEVFAAEHVHIDKKFAIKLLKPEIVSNAEAVTRFRQEARSSSSIGHRNIIAIEDFGMLPDGRIYMCMELLNGAALNDMIQQPMGADRLLNIMIQTGHGLAAAHAKNIIHRDMKPENIFVTIGSQGEDIPKILDFGIAKVSGNDGQNHLTRTGTIFGTPFYMAPEQALGNPVDARTDIYAVGVIMYECFAGSLPFMGESFMGILTQHITTEPEPIAQRAAKAGRQLPMGLADIIMRCMQKNPDQRYRTMDELVNALIGVYRGIAGPGMSTYMEAFPVGSAQHMLSPTPPPMQGGYSNPHSATVAANMGSGPNQMVPGMTPQGMLAQGHSSQLGLAQSSPSGLYDPSMGVHTIKKKSSMGLIIAILVLLAAGGAIAAVVLLGKKDDKAGTGSGSGSDVVATSDFDGNALTQKMCACKDVACGDAVNAEWDKGYSPDNPHKFSRSEFDTCYMKLKEAGHGGSDHVGSDHVGSDHVGSDHTVPTNGGSDTVIPPNGSGTGSNGSNTSNPPGPTPVMVVVTTEPDVSAFEVYEGGVVVKNAFGDGVPVIPGQTRTLVLKTKGYLDASFKADGKKKRVSVRLKRPATVPNGGSNTTHTNPPTGPDCTNSLVDTTKHCRDVYCAHHPDDSKHGCDAE